MVVRSSQALLTVACVMLGCSSAFAAPATVASAAPDPVARAAALAPLREIGHVHARTAFCQAVFDRGGLATATALNNDASLAATSQYLSHVDLDDNALNKPKAVSDMQRTYAALMAYARDAIDESKALRKLADDAPTPEQKAALIAYADAIGGALHRQELVASDYRRFAVYLEAHQPVSSQQQDHENVTATVSQPRPGDYNLNTPAGWRPDNWAPVTGTEGTQFPAMPAEFDVRPGDPRWHVTPRLTDLAKDEAAHLTEIHSN
ncbi:MAG: hypothetical protein IAI50_02970, partial [Candidatus Eremiobacteraeota bacterium]|nr:hypothetical protein [Candidatus Eremiobacteraeota bacterium]